MLTLETCPPRALRLGVIGVCRTGASSIPASVSYCLR
jgi:hypothetical protein